MLSDLIKWLRRKLVSVATALKFIGKGFMEASLIETFEFETRELENIFAMLLLGSLIGLPSPPLSIVARVLPHMSEELKVMMSRARMSVDQLGVFGIFSEPT